MATPRSRTMFQRMRELYGEFVRNEARAPLLAERVPESLRAYIPYAELWGVADDLEREQLVERAPHEARLDLQQTIAQIDDALDEWLAGPEADETSPSPEYIAFSAMRMAADFT